MVDEDLAHELPTLQIQRGTDRIQEQIHASKNRNGIAECVSHQDRLNDQLRCQIRAYECEGVGIATTLEV